MRNALLLTLLSLLLYPSIAQAISPEQRKVIDSGAYYFNVEESQPLSCSGNFSGSENAEIIFNYFVSKGYTPFQAAGIVGNISHESGFKPQRLQGTGVDIITPAESLSSNESLGWGLVQWTPPSKFLKHVTPISDANKIEVQLEFLWNQLEGTGPESEKRAGDEIKGTTTLEDAVLAFQGNKKVGGQYFGFERPADQSGSVEERTNAARDALAKFGSGTNLSTTTTSCNANGSVGGFALPTDRAFYDANVGLFTKTHHDYPAADIGMIEGTPIYSMTNGKVYSANQGGFCGTGITIETDDGTKYNYCHGIDGGSVPGAKLGDAVTAGQHIMNSGNTGNSSGPHLHLQITTSDGNLRCPQTLFTSIAAGSPVAVNTLPTSGCTHTN